MTKKIGLSYSTHKKKMINYKLYSTSNVRISHYTSEHAEHVNYNGFCCKDANRNLEGEWG